jgi:hypothetical protein
MENRRIYLPPIHDMLNRPNVFVDQNGIINDHDFSFLNSNRSLYKQKGRLIILFFFSLTFLF